MIWEEVEEKYGKELADRMKTSEYLVGNTVSIGKDGKIDIPERDIDLAYRDVTGKKIHAWEWD